MVSGESCIVVLIVVIIVLYFVFCINRHNIRSTMLSPPDKTDEFDHVAFFKRGFFPLRKLNDLSVELCDDRRFVLAGSLNERFET